eukprot:NODE_303_length_1936_cov_35.043455_g214_i0.p1 GENE.NODE_303_length_1936_cov_35.043455_g214_i0~~NODE_303_length_1936_cov_35.043455_g214_i0.p1  ORF type:complete len:454 (+),score=101.56 NODE_303_length_1936_cov_35.043455_g214_i0:59-1363(+)
MSDCSCQSLQCAACFPPPSRSPNSTPKNDNSPSLTSVRWGIGPAQYKFSLNINPVIEVPVFITDDPDMDPGVGPPSQCGVLRCSLDTPLRQVRALIEQLPQAPKQFSFLRVMPDGSQIEISRPQESGKHRFRLQDFGKELLLLRHYAVGDCVGFDEDHIFEFKSLKLPAKWKPGKPFDVVKSKAGEYINAFLNSDGGSLYFGVADDGQIEDIELNAEDRDMLRKLIDAKVQGMDPPVDPDLVRTAFISVIPPQATKFQNRYMIAVHVQPGRRPVYYTSAEDSIAWMRRDGSTHRMEPDIIAQREENGLRGAAVASWRHIGPCLDYWTYIKEKRLGFSGREWLFSKVDTWCCSREAPVMAITGEQGAGKTAFMAQVVCKWDVRIKSCKLVAYHFCRGEVPETLLPSNFVRSIAGSTCRPLDTCATLKAALQLKKQ